MREQSLNPQSGRCAGHLSPLAGRGRIALAIRVRGSLRECGRNCFENARHIPQHIVVPESQNPIVVIDKPFVANHIARIVRVLASIDLDNEPTLAADQINCVWTDRLLPDEFVTIETPRPEAIPQSRLRLGGGPSKTPGSLSLDLVSFAHVETPPHPDCFAIRPLPARGER